MDEKVVYEKHPVTAERKSELRQKGYKIIDAKFAPDDYEHPEPIKAEKADKKVQAQKPEPKAPEAGSDSAPK